LPINKQLHIWIQRIFIFILIAVFLTIFCWSVLALPPSSSESRVGQFNQGIPVYWPYHVLLISIGFILVVAGFIFVKFHKTGNWYKNHWILETSGVICIFAGLFIGVYMVALSGLPHLSNIHEIVGIIIGILVIITIPLGYFIKRANKSKKVIRMSHRWLGRIIFTLLVINIGLGLFFLSIVLRR
jgi:hypothetical protein